MQPTDDEIKYFNEFCYKMYGKTFPLKEMFVDNNGCQHIVFDLNDPIPDDPVTIRFEAEWAKKGYYHVTIKNVDDLISFASSLTIEKANALGLVEEDGEAVYDKQCINYKGSVIEVRKDNSLVYIFKDERWICTIRMRNGLPWNEYAILPSFNAIRFKQVHYPKLNCYYTYYDINTGEYLGMQDSTVAVFELKN